MNAGRSMVRVGTCDLEVDREPGYLVVPRADSAINAALQAVGAHAEPGLDEYATVGLTRHRMVDDWLRPPFGSNDE